MFIPLPSPPTLIKPYFPRPPWGACPGRYYDADNGGIHSERAVHHIMHVSAYTSTHTNKHLLIYVLYDCTALSNMDLNLHNKTSLQRLVIFACSNVNTQYGAAKHVQLVSMLITTLSWTSARGTPLHKTAHVQTLYTAIDPKAHDCLRVAVPYRLCHRCVRATSR